MNATLKNYIKQSLILAAQMFFLIVILYCFEYDIGYFKTIVDNTVFFLAHSPPRDAVVVNAAEFRGHLLVPKIHTYCKLQYMTADENGLNPKYLCM
jgi:hypothetical protein